jgi:hypothetical protein
MARQFLTGLNLNKNELLNARIQNLASAPDAPVSGQIYYNTGDNTLRYYTGEEWLTLAQGGSVEDAIQDAIDAATTDDIDEGSINQYYTTARAKTDAAALLTGATLENITITGDGDGLTITAENGVADSDTDDLTEGETNKYFTDQRALDATASAYDVAGAASAVQDNLDDHTEASSEVHGLGEGVNVVGDTAAQTLTNKTLGSGTVLSADVDADQNKIIDLEDPTDAQDAATKNYVDGEVGDHSDATTGVHGVTGDVVGTSDEQTLTNKTLGSGTALSANLSADNNRITDLAAPVDPNDAATKAYVDAVSEGLHVHASVKAATTGNVNLGSGIAAVDGVTINNGDRVLVRAQTNAAQNGIYVSNGTTLSRAADYDSVAEIKTGDFVFVDQGTTYANSGFVQTEIVATVGTDNIAWTQFSGAGTFLAGDGLTLDGNEFNVVGTADRITVAADAIDIASTYVGQTSITTVGTIATGTWEATDVAVAHGGTGASNAADARTNLGATTKYTAANPELLSSGGGVTWLVEHNLGTRAVVVQVYELDTFDEVEVDVERTNTDDVTLRWVSASTVAAAEYQVVIVG